MLEKLFGSGIIEKILFFLLMNKKGYGAQIAKIHRAPLYSVQKGLARLEDGGIIVAQNQGKTRLYQFNPRYPFLNELEAFLTKAYSFLPKTQKEKYYETPIRQRPRRTGKPIKKVSYD